jgi:hypothetical protein
LILPLDIPAPDSAERSRRLPRGLSPERALDRLHARRMAVVALIDLLERYLRAPVPARAACVEITSARTWSSDSARSRT